MKVIAEYNSETGMIADMHGAEFFIGPLIEFIYASDSTKSNNIENLVKLKNAGFTTDEIVELSRKELI